MVIVDLVIIAVICVCIIDISGFTDNLTAHIHKWLTGNKTPFELKPITCSLCMSFWSGLVYLIIQHEVTLLNLMILLLVAVGTPIIKDVIQTTYNIILKIIDFINEKIYDN